MKIKLLRLVSGEELIAEVVNSSEDSYTLKDAIERHLDELLQLNKEELLEHRYTKFRVLGKFVESNNIEEIYNEMPQKIE